MINRVKIDKDKEIDNLVVNYHIGSVKERNVIEVLIVLLDLNLIECYQPEKGNKKYVATRKNIELPKAIKSKMIEEYIINRRLEAILK